MHIRYFFCNFASANPGRSVRPAEAMTVMKSIKHTLCLLIVALLCCTAVHAAYTPKTVPHPRTSSADAFVSNPDGILTAEQQSEIQQVAKQLYDISGVELVTVVLDDIGHADAFDFSVELFNHWGIGRREQNTGVLILFAKRSRDIRITTGGGVEGLLPDAVCEQILDETMIPALKRGKYAQGLLAGNRAIAERLTSQQAKEELLLGYKREPVRETPWLWFSIISWLVALIALFLYWIEPPCPKCGKKGSKSELSRIDVKPTYYSSGQGTRFYTCPYCGHEWKQTYSIPKKERPVSTTSSGSGGVFGGSSGGFFGGGSTFGGGAGGKF